MSSLSPGTKLGRYEIRSKIGEGGMGEVYLAEDTKLERTVALKVLPADVAADQQRMRRFVQEAKAASALNHPNILTIHEVGEDAGTNFIATEFIDGDTLRQRMQGARMKLSEMLNVAIQTADALCAAHEAGIIHRDIKPENIMLRKRDDYVKVLDFGLAKLIEQPPVTVDTEAPTKTLFKTEEGVVMGTVTYMSPEQARGLEVDARTDIWSLGVVLYEMVAACLPFEGSTTSEILVAIINEKEPPPLARFAREVPAELERIVTKALRKNRDQRYQTIKDLLLDLKSLKQEMEFATKLEQSRASQASWGANDASDAKRGMVATDRVPPAASTVSGRHSVRVIKQRKRTFAVAVGVLLLATIGFGYWRYTRDANNTATIESIAVLPLVNESADASMEYLSDGITESIINSLSELPKLRVLPRVSVFRYKGRQIDPQVVGREMGVGAVLTGKVVLLGDTLSIQTELIDVNTNSQLWGQKYHRKLSDILAVQDEIANEVSAKLRLKLSAEEHQQLAKRYTKSAEAYQLYLKGRYYWKKYSREGVEKSIEYFNQAIEKDPNYALAYSGLADAYNVLGIEHQPPREAFPNAKAAAEKALQLDESLAAAHISIGTYKLFYEWDWPGAIKAAQRAKELSAAYAKAIELNTNYDDSHHFYCQALDTMGQPHEAIAEMKRALELDPLSLSMNFEMGWSFYMARDYDQAIAQCRKTLELDPNFLAAYFCTAQAYEQKHMHSEALADLSEVKARTAPAASQAAFLMEHGYIYGLSGQRAQAQQMIQELKEREGREYVDPTLVGLIYIALGEKNQAFLWLEKAYAARSPWMTWLKVEPKFDPLRSDARFTNLTRRVGLPQ